MKPIERASNDVLNKRARSEIAAPVMIVKLFFVVL